MANLETLELTISGNAESASQGLSSLIGSLSALSRQVGKSVGGLLRLNKELEKLKGFSNIKFSGIEKVAKDVKNAIDLPTGKLDALQMKMEGLSEAMDKAANRGNKLGTANKYLQSLNVQKQIDAETRALRGETQAFKANASVMKEYKNLPAGAFRPWMYGPKPLPKIESAVGSATMRSEEERRALNPQWYRDYNTPEGRAMILARNEALRHNGDQMSIASDPSTLEPFKEGYKEVEQIAEETAPKFQKLKEGWQNFTNGMKTASGRLKEIIPRFGLLNRVMRIASTMMIRMGVRALFKGIKEGLDNYYQYSKQIGDAYASTMDNMSSTWSQLKNQMGAAIAPALTAALPVLNSLASAAITAFNALSQLFSLLTGKSTWSKATTQVSDYGDAINKANGGGGGGGMKELLANFDELNVIASESGGGGGGGATQSAEEIGNMFKEMTDFDKGIRDLATFIRETITWISKNFDVVLSTALLIKTAIFGWKISKAFEGSLASIGKIVTGASVLTISAILSYDFGSKIGSGEELNAGDIIEGVAGVLAGALGGYIIGGGVGAAVGIGISLFVGITGYFIGKKDQLEKLKWGSTSLTPEEIKKYVQKQFSFDIYAQIESLEIEINNTKSARDRLNEVVHELSYDLDKVQLGIDDSPEMFAKLKEDADNLVDKLKDYLSTSSNLVDTLFTVSPVSKKLQNGVKGDISEADKVLIAYFEGQGKKIADAYDRGMSTGWKNNEKKEIMDLLEHLENIVQKADSAKALNKFKAATKIGLTGLTKETAQAILEETRKAYNEYKVSMEKATQEAVESLLYRAELAEAAGMPVIASKLRADAESLVNNFQKSTEQKLNEAMQPMKAEWSDALREIYGSDYTRAIIEHVGEGFRRDLKNKLRKDEGEAKALVQETLDRVLRVNKITKDAADLFGITGWDLLGNRAKGEFVNSIIQAVGVEGVRLIKETTKISAFDLITLTNWKSFENSQRLEFIKAIANAYGSSEALRAAKAAGINVGNEITKGLGSNDAATKAKAQELVNMINDEIKKSKIVVSAEADLEVKIEAIIDAKPTIGTTKSSTVTKVKGDATIANGKKAIPVATYATGGFPTQGDLFIANEGRTGAELVGSINGKTGVANQEQIIEGIQRGVAEANSEQNALLRQQNELLRGILEKDNVVRFGASAALGRIARQSLDLYGSMVGG